MTRVRVGLLCALVVASAGSAHAQGVAQGETWYVAVDYLNVWTRGNDVHVGDVFTEHQTVSGTAAQNRLDYGVTFDPIVTQMSNDQSVMLSGGIRGQRWGFGIRGWRAVADGSASGSRSTTPETATSQFITGIRMWDNSIVPVINIQDPSLVSPVTYHADNRLEHLQVEVFGERRWLAGENFNLAARFGFARARTENSRSEGQTQRANCFTAAGDCVLPPNVTNSTLTNDITIDSESEATMNLTGPLLGIAGDAHFKRLRLDWLVSHAVLFGTAETTGTWTDIDNINEVTVTSGVQTQTTTVLDGVLPREQDERAVVPTLDLQIKASFKVVKGVSVGGGVFSSTSFGQTVAPAFVVPDDWTDVQGTAWRSQKRDVTYAGWSIFAGFGF
jgi:hypothetical protein